MTYGRYWKTYIQGEVCDYGNPESSFGLSPDKALSAILSLIEKELPRKQTELDGSGSDWDKRFNQGFNSCLAEIKERLR